MGSSLERGVFEDDVCKMMVSSLERVVFEDDSG